MDDNYIRKIATEIYNQLGTKYGVASVPFHTHNGIDSTQLNPSAFLGWPVFQVADATMAPTDAPQNGTFRFYVDTVPNYVLWVYFVYNDAGFVRGWHSFTSGGGGGGSPGGPINSVQFNNPLGTFDGEQSFTYDPLTFTIGLGVEANNSTILGADATTADTNAVSIFISGGVATGVGISGSVGISGGASNTTGGTAGNIYIDAGSSVFDATPGSVEITAGSSGNIFSPGANPGGSVTIQGGDSDLVAGNVSIISGNGLSGTGGGSILLTLGQDDSFGSTCVQISQFDAIGSAGPRVYFGNGTPDFSGGSGVIGIKNRATAPSGSPTGGGVLYVESGALHYLGSSGTDTIIAPA